MVLPVALVVQARAKIEVGLSSGQGRKHQLSSSNLATVLSALEEE